jgi:hypothetical protein
MYYLSFRFYFKWSKLLFIISSTFVNIFVIGYLIYHFNNIDLTNTNTIIAILVSIIYVITSTIKDYYLYKSKTVSFDSSFLYIWENKKISRKIEIACIKRVVRKFHFYYLITFHEKCSPFKKILFFISPNPPFTKPENVKKLIKIIQNN